MSRILCLLALFFLIAFPISSIATPVPIEIYRMGNNNRAVVNIRSDDWNIQGDMVHPDHSKGLSLSVRPLRMKGRLWSIRYQDLVGLANFRVVCDGTENGGRHGTGHVSLYYIGPPIPRNVLETILTHLPWQRQ